MLEVKTVNGAGPFVTQLCPPTGEAVVTPSIPALGESGSSGLFMHLNDDADHFEGETFPVSSIWYGSTNDTGDGILPGGNKPAGETWELRGYFPAAAGTHSVSSMTRIDSVNVTHMLQ